MDDNDVAITTLLIIFGMAISAALSNYMTENAKTYSLANDQKIINALKDSCRVEIGTCGGLGICSLNVSGFSCSNITYDGQQAKKPIYTIGAG